jgi:hypothetical protein
VDDQQTTIATPPPGINGVADQYTTPKWRVIPYKLKLVDSGKIAERVTMLRNQAQTTSPQDMYLLLDPAQVTEAAQAQFSQKSRWREGLRNFCLFLPLIVTWLSFGMASYAFAQSALINTSNTSQSFFALWINGFPDITSVTVGKLHFPLLLGQWRWFTFGDVAFTDFLLLSLVLLLNQFTHTAESRASKDAIEIGVWMREELVQLRHQSLVRRLGPGESNDTPEWAVQVHTAINHLHAVLQSIESTVKVSQSNFGETITRFTDTYQTQSNSVDNLIQNTRDIENAVTYLNTIYDKQVKPIFERLESISVKMGDQFEDMADQQELASKALSGIAYDIKTSSQAIYELARPFAAVGLAQMAQTMAQQQKDNLALLQQMEGRLNQSAAQYNANQNAGMGGFFNRLLKRKGR